MVDWKIILPDRGFWKVWEIALTYIVEDEEHFALKIGCCG